MTDAQERAEEAETAIPEKGPVATAANERVDAPASEPSAAPHDGEPAHEPAPSSAPADIAAATPGLPRRIEGGFGGVADDLDRRARDWAMMVRLLEQQRLHLETSEAERERLLRELEAVLPFVRSSSKSLAATLATTKAGDVSGNLSALFMDNLHALDGLENVAKALTANLLWTRSSWEQYARSVIGAEKMRSELKG